ncbi:MAG: TonB-dependent receptor [Balneolales bacterium]
MLTISLCLIVSGLAMGQYTSEPALLDAPETVMVAAEKQMSNRFLHLAPLEVNDKNRSALNKTISVNLEKMNLEQALHYIADQGNLRLSYSKDVTDRDRWNQPVNLSLEADVTVLGALHAALDNTGLGLKISHHGILIVQEDDQLKEYSGNIETDNLILQETVTGTVTDVVNGEALPGVNILVKGSSTGTSTDIDGEYQLNTSSLSDTLIFSYVGYQTQEIPVDGRTELDVELEFDVFGTDELVVVGYGTQKSTNVIGSVTTIQNEELSASPVSRISNALAGRLPGAIVQQRSGEPGDDQSDILIRGSSTLGNNSPLVVIDGIQGRDMNSLQSNDIESITVLKDASAAIYGARAANGVILITTKRGETDMPATFSYGFSQGFLSPTMLPEMADAATYATMIREMQSYRGADNSNMMFSLEDIEKYESGEYPWTHPNTNWLDAALADYSTTRNHNFSVSGGTQSISYYGSFGSQLDDGIYTNSATSYNRYNLKANVDARINEYFSIGIDMSGSQENRMYATKSSESIFSSLLRSYPTWTATYPNGLPGPDIEYGDQPMVAPSFETGFDEDNRYRLNNLLNASLEIPGVEGLSLSGYYAYDMFFGQRKLFQTPFTLYELDESSYFAAGNTGSEDGSDFLVGTEKAYSEPRLTDYYEDFNNTTTNLMLDYTNTINDVHDISSFVAYENSDNYAQGIEAFRRYFVSEQLPYLFAGGDAQKDNSGDVSLDAQENYFGRISYNYDETYFLQFSFRRDGSLRFSEESGRWGNFPSFLAGWTPSRYDWWQEKAGFIDELKLKASWGQMGNDLVDPFQYLSSYEYGTGGVYGANRTYSSSLSQSGVPNPFITWEVANVYNTGWEARFLNHKLIFDADFFYERRSNILVQRNASVPQFTGISLPDENFGIVDNKGFELILGYQETQRDFSYGINGNFTFARNKVIEYDEPERSVPWQVRTGNPQGSQLLYNSEGIFRDMDHVNSLPHVTGAQPGDIIIEDYDGDGEITSADRILFPKTANPEITYGISFNVTYKNFGLSGLVQGVGTAMRRMYTDDRQGTGGNYFQYDAEGRWTPDNINASKPRAFERNEEYWRSSHLTDYSFQNTAYARMKNLQLTYSIPESVRNMLRVRDAQVYFSGQNLFLISSDKKIMDPELVGDNAYPLMRVLSFGANITF